METEYNECPYCGEDTESDLFCDEPLRDGESSETECPKCGKMFMASASWSVDYTTWKAPCLNEEGNHDWKPVTGYPEEFFKGKYRCTYCGKQETRKDDSMIDKVN